MEVKNKWCHIADSEQDGRGEEMNQSFRGAIKDLKNILAIHDLRMIPGDYHSKIRKGTSLILTKQVAEYIAACGYRKLKKEGSRG